MEDHLELTPEETIILKKDNAIALFLTGCYAARMRIIKEELALAELTKDFSLVQTTIDRIETYLNGLAGIIYQQRVKAENETEM